MNDFVRSYIAGSGTAAQMPSANLPVRLYVSGTTNPDRVIRCTGGEDLKAIGISKRGVATSGLTVAVAMQPGFQFLAQVNTTCKQGDNLSIKDGSQFKVCGSTAGLHFCARAERARTNAGLTWMTWVPGGTV